jgi:hypothetical protein
MLKQLGEKEAVLDSFFKRFAGKVEVYKVLTESVEML